ncbi:MAG: enoyl-CoA hydratase-related protein [Chloroflexi bacterium]|nr:enoyl-CoA hydratase-related protein [Chloroflexota bacterium]
MVKVETERRGRIYVVRINRPEARNAVDAETAGLLDEAVTVFKRDDGLRVMVLTGAGNIAFCAGADLKSARGLALRKGSDESGPMGFSRVTDVQKPTIAAVNGYCLAGGLELACWCDFRISARSAKFGVVNRRWGVPLIDGGTQRLPRIVGLGNALYLIETGAMIDAGQALRMGLVQEVVADGQALERALELAAVMADYPWASLVNDRRAAYEGLALGLAEGIRREQDLHTADLQDGEMQEGLERFISGHRPQPPTPPA